jgi:hypothetical protein
MREDIVIRSCPHCFEISGVPSTAAAISAPYTGGVETVARWMFSRIEFIVLTKEGVLVTNVTRPIRSPELVSITRVL